VAGLTNTPWIERVEAVWAHAQELHPDLPDARIAVGSLHRPPRRLGHWLPGEHELYVAAALEAKPAERVVGVILHEAAHALGEARGITTTSRQGRYHSSRFAGLAAEVGLCPSKDRPDGLGWDRLSPPALVAWADVIEQLEEARLA
jgi:hypothetical protein